MMVTVLPTNFKVPQTFRREFRLMSEDLEAKLLMRIVFEDGKLTLYQTKEWIGPEALIEDWIRDSINSVRQELDGE